MVTLSESIAPNTVWMKVYVWGSLKNCRKFNIIKSEGLPPPPTPRPPGFHQWCPPPPGHFTSVKASVSGGGMVNQKLEAHIMNVPGGGLHWWNPGGRGGGGLHLCVLQVFGLPSPPHPRTQRPSPKWNVPGGRTSVWSPGGRGWEEAFTFDNVKFPAIFERTSHENLHPNSVRCNGFC